jgi:hypothetical protein
MHSTSIKCTQPAKSKPTRQPKTAQKHTRAKQIHLPQTKIELRVSHTSWHGFEGGKGGVVVGGRWGGANVCCSPRLFLSDAIDKKSCFVVNAFIQTWNMHGFASFLDLGEADLAISWKYKGGGPNGFCPCMFLAPPGIVNYDICLNEETIRSNKECSIS